MFRHSSRRLPLNDSINGLSVGFLGREKSIVIPCSYAHLSRLFEINSLPLSVWIRTGRRLSSTRNASIMLTTSSPFSDFPAWSARHSRLKLSTIVSARKRRPLNRLSDTKSIFQHRSIWGRAGRCWRRAALTCLRGAFCAGAQCGYHPPH